MAHAYYALPLRLDQIVQQQAHPTCSLPASIAQHLYLVITTHFNESRFDPQFGCSLWEEDFSVQVGSRWKDDIRQSIEESVKTYEKRLTSVQVRVELADQELQGTPKNHRVKRRLSIWIDGLITRTNERFVFQRSIYLAPLSTD